MTANGVVTARKVLIVFFGAIAASIGTAVCTVALMRYFYPVQIPGHPPVQDFDLKIFSIGAGIFFGGLMLIFTGNPATVWELARSQLPGGTRRTDPLPKTPEEIAAAATLLKTRSHDGSD